MPEKKELTPAEESWLDNWIDGIAMFIARSPDESAGETAGEYEYIKARLNEKKPELYEYARKWRIKLKEALAL